MQAWTPCSHSAQSDEAKINVFSLQPKRSFRTTPDQVQIQSTKNNLHGPSNRIDLFFVKRILHIAPCLAQGSHVDRNKATYFPPQVGVTGGINSLYDRTVGPH